MKSPIILLVLFIHTPFMVANASQAISCPSQVILDSSQDTTIMDFNPDCNYGLDQALGIGHHPGGLMDPLIQFDLSPYSGVVVESAYLRLYVYMQGGSFPPTDIWIGRVTGSWDEMTVTWDTFPGADDFTDISGPDSIGDWWVIDVAGYVNSWVSGGYGNYGFILGANDPNTNYFWMCSREYLDSLVRPQLELNYHDVSVQPTSLGSIKAILK